MVNGDVVLGAIHVLIVHFNTPQLTARLVRDFPRRTPKGRPVFVHILDNFSTKQNLSILRASIEGLEGLRLQISSTNLGFGLGVNLLAGASYIRASDILWILNPDTRLRPNCLELLEEELDLGDFSIISPLIYSGSDENPLIWFCGGTVKIPEVRAVHFLVGKSISEAPSRSFETDFVTGAAPMMLASTYWAVGGLPANYFLYWEDAYLSWQARALGFRLGVVPSSLLWHAVGASSGAGQSATFYYWFARNRFVYGRDIGIPLRQVIIGRGFIETIRPVARTLFRERRPRLAKFRAAIRGTIDGWKQTRVRRKMAG